MTTPSELHSAIIQELKAISPDLSPKKIVIAMSGGVDSTTTAALLKDAGHQVIGVTMQLYDHGVAIGKKGACCAGKDIYDAQMAAAHLGIPHYVFNYEDIFKEKVIDKFAESYANGETPVPCILCNKSVKFEDLLSASMQLGGDYLATGHYVQKKKTERGWGLFRGANPRKDQSYFLFTITPTQLEKLLFPLGGLHKDETRELARYYGLEIANKPDSQDICFVPDGDYREVLRKSRPDLFKVGNIVDSSGTVLGQHDGIANYTLGQRKGINIQHNSVLYVIKIRSKSNEIVVGNREQLMHRDIILKETNWLFSYESGQDSLCRVKIRSAHDGLPCNVKILDNSTAKIELYDPYFALTPGQACVLYQDDEVLGGGWISKVISS